MREANAMGRQSVLLPRALRTRGVALHPSGDDVDVVFLLHGVLATAGVLGPLEARLREAGVQHVASFSYHPLRTVASLARELRREVMRVPVRARVHLVGHSLGGVVARWFVQECGGSGRVHQTISLASPFAGTEIARWVPTALGRELSPGSPLLARLCEPSRQPRGVRHTSFVAERDAVVVPPMSAAFPFGDVIVVRDVGHNGMLFHRGVAAQVCARVVDDAGSSRAA